MLFRRRTPLTPRQRLRSWLWPSMPLGRVGQYYNFRVRRLPGSSYSIAVGFASGVAVSLTPCFGGHIILALAFTWLLRGSYLAAMLGTLVGNPWVTPPILFFDYYLGCHLLGIPLLQVKLHHLSVGYIMHHFSEILLPMLAGGLVFGVVGGFATFGLVYLMVGTYRRKRIDRLAARRQDADNQQEAGGHHEVA